MARLLVNLVNFGNVDTISISKSRFEPINDKFVINFLKFYLLALTLPRIAIYLHGLIYDIEYYYRVEGRRDKEERGGEKSRHEEKRGRMER